MSSTSAKQEKRAAWTLVTGGSKRLGAAISLALAAQGYSVLIHYRTGKDEAERLANQILDAGHTAATVQGDFSSFMQVSAFVERLLLAFPHIEGIVNNVGIYGFGSALHTPIEEVAHLFQVNLYAALQLIQSCASSLQHHDGFVCNIGMVGSATLTARCHATAYCLTKTALYSLTRSLAKEMAPQGVRVNMVSPGYLPESVDLPADISRLPMQRIATFEEVAQAVCFLCDSRNSYVTGQNIEVGGGVFL